VSRKTDKDFADFMGKSGFGDTAIQRFLSLADTCPMWSPDATPKPAKEIVSKNPRVIAERFLNETGLRHDGALELRYYRDRYYIYNVVKCCYHETPDYDILVRVTQFMHGIEEYATACTPKLLASIMVNLKGLIHVPADVLLPVFLDGKTMPLGQYVVMQNGIMFIDGLIEGWADVLSPNTPSFFTVSALPYPYKPGADCPLFKKFLDSILPDQQDSVLMLQEFIGWCLVYDNTYQRYLLFLGPGANGKGTTVNIIIRLIGNENVSSLSLENFNDKFARYEAFGKLLNVAADIAEVDKAAEGVLKRWTGGDKLQWERKHKDAVSAPATARIIMLANTKPAIHDKTEAAWRRLIVVPFNITITDDQKNPNLANEIADAELTGIFNWAVEGYKRLKARGHLIEPSSSLVEKEAYKDEMNSVRGFLKSECVEDACCKVPVKDMLQSYQVYCKNTGRKACGDSVFGRELKKLFPKVEKDRDPFHFKALQNGVVSDKERRETFYKGIRIVGDLCHRSTFDPNFYL